MKRRIGIFFGLIVLFLLNSMNAQTLIDGLTQNTNYYFYQSTYNLNYISSIDGLNIFDGENVSVYKSSTHNMYGDNIQSDFYEDSEGNVWFATYQAINVHYPEKDSLNYFFCKREDDTDIKNDYRIIDLENDSLWILADDLIFIYDVVRNKIINSFPSYVNAIFDIERISSDSTTLFNAISPKGFYSFEINNNDYSINDSLFIELPIRSFKRINDYELLIGTVDGSLIRYDFKNQKILTSNKVSTSGIVGIENINDSIYNIICYGEIVEFDIANNILYKRIKLDFQKDELNRFNFYKKIKDVNWISSDGTGVFYNKIHDIKFENWPIDNEVKPFVFNLKKIPSTENILVTDRNNKLSIINKFGVYSNAYYDFLSEQNKLQLARGIFVDSNAYVSFSNQKFFNYNFKKKSTSILKSNVKIDFNYISHLLSLSTNRFSFIAYPNKLFQGSIISDSISLKQIFEIELKGKSIESQFSINFNQFYISNNDEEIFVLDYDSDSLTISSSIDIAGGIKSICKSNSNDSIFISNYSGLYKLNTLNFGYVKIKGPNNIFNQTIYSLEQSSPFEYWMSTNNGLYYWNEKKDSIHNFGLADGIQAMEFNTGASIKDSKGNLYFGGVNGINVFHPDSISLSNTYAPVMISEYKVDDAKCVAFGSSYFVQKIELPYSQNTVSFTFHALDYADMESTRVKYKLEGYEDEYVVSDKNIGFARYPNLPPGKYTLNIIGANADRVWNKTVKEVDIIIHPPFWQTWWFRLLSVLLIGSIIYLIFRSYYTRKLREKDFKLKEQELIISKQKALEAERNRIAGEMHDDLGGGLTTISYLSQRIRGKLTDEKSEKQLNKIISHTKDLVSNMSEIIWAMNSGFNNMDNLIAYIRRYSKEYLSTHGIPLEVNNEIQADDLGHNYSGEVRRNVLLVVKEILHNIVKHSKSTHVDLTFSFGGSLEITISDHGIGLQKENQFGNGLSSIEKRIKNIGGTLERENINGLTYRITLPDAE